eukprot:7019323-Ditylum_brightwellii.AAC.1
MCHCLQQQFQVNCNRWITKIISAINVSYKRTVSNSVSSQSVSFYELYKRKMDDCKKLPGGLFESSKQLQLFKHNFKIAMYGQANCHKILHISTYKGVKNILTNFMLLGDENLNRARAKRSPEEATATKNMYIVLWKLFVHQIKTTMQTITDDNKEDGPALLCHLLCQYMGTAELVIRTYQTPLNNLLEKLKELDFDIDAFCDYASEMLKTLKDAGGNDKQASLKLNEEFVLTS